MSTGFSPKVLTALAERSGGICEVCCWLPATEAHHRQYRSRGGAHTIENALHVCGFGNTSGCHGIAHRIGERNGWSVRSRFHPAQVPVLIGNRWVYFTADGTYEPVNPADAIEYLHLIGARKAV